MVKYGVGHVLGSGNTRSAFSLEFWLGHKGAFRSVLVVLEGSSVPPREAHWSTHWLLGMQLCDAFDEALGTQDNEWTCHSLTFSPRQIMRSGLVHLKSVP